MTQRAIFHTYSHALLCRVRQSASWMKHVAEDEPQHGRNCQ